MKTKRAPQCLLSVSNGHWCQESYETASRDAGRRAHKLRLKGFDAVVSAMGPQETQWGIIKLTLVTITPGEAPDLAALPKVEMMKRPEE